MAPTDAASFNSAARWIDVDSGWFGRLACLEVLSVAERVHLARIALQQQWICDVEDTEAKRAAIESLGLHVATTNLGYLIVSGSPTMTEYFAFRGDVLSLVETGVLYGYPPSAVIAYTGITPSRPPHESWMTPATYFLGGAYSTVQSDRERAAFESQWGQLAKCAPELSRKAEQAFQRWMSEEARQLRQD